MLTGEQIGAARALVRWEETDLAEASGLPLMTIKRLEDGRGPLDSRDHAVEAARSALEAAGVAFLPEDASGGPGVRLRKKGRRDEGLTPDQLNAENDG